MDIAEIEAEGVRLAEESRFVGQLRDAINRVVVGQRDLVDRVLEMEDGVLSEKQPA